MTCRLPFLLCALLALPNGAHADEITQLMERGHWKEARAAVETLARSRPGDARTLYLTSRVKVAFNQTEEALALAEKASALEPGNAEYHCQVSQVCGSLTQGAGKLKAFSLARRVRKEAEQALALDPGHLDAKEVLIDFYSIAPGLVGGDNKKAAGLAAEMVRAAPARGLLAQAQLALRAKNEARAESLCLRAITADPSSYDAHMALARFYTSESRKQWDQAEKHARAAVGVDPERIGAYSGLAGLFAHLERWNDLDAALTEAERKVPDNLAPHYQAARILLNDGRELGRAERYLRRYLTRDPEGAAPSWAHAHWRLGLVLDKQGRKPEAIAELETALKLNPELDQAKKDLKRIKK